MERITSTKNRRVVEARKLSSRKHRRRQGRFLVEGLQILHMALDAGAEPVEVFYCEDLFTGPEARALLQRFAERGATLVPVAPHVLQSLSERETPQGLVATFRLFEHTLDQIRWEGNGLTVVLDRLQDPGNLGTLIRTADAVAARAVILIEPCVDPFDPKTVRGSMGSIFNVPIVRVKDVAHLFRTLRDHRVRVVGTDVREGRLWGEGLWEGEVALLLGNEARGLSPDVREHVDAYARLPIVGKAESLNVAVAGGVFMYCWLRAQMDHGPR
ncbi:MAG: RNA methyltransferase [Chloroflexi bacterium]|nr:RNA methyltransferase [Chloroflexota bacterium]